MADIIPMRLTEKSLQQLEIERENNRIVYDLYNQGKKKTHPRDDVKKEEKGAIIKVEEAFFANTTKPPRAI